jgi:hypothetical protein
MRWRTLSAAMALAMAAVAVASVDGPTTRAAPPALQLLAGQTVDVGDIVAVYDSEHVRIDVTATPGWCLRDVHLALATSAAGFPQTKKGNPIPGKFPIKRVHQPCATTDTYLLPTTAVVGWTPGAKVLVGLHAEVWNGATAQQESAWGDGWAFDGANWATYAAASRPDPVVLTFDDINDFDGTPLLNGEERPIPDGYGDFAWQQTGVFNPDPPLYGGYAVKSETNLAFITEAGNFEVPGYPLPAGSPLNASATGDFDFVGAWFSAVYRDDLQITVRAYDDGVQVGQTMIVVDRFGPTWFQFDSITRFTSIDRVEMTANDGFTTGDSTTWDYFGFDDFTYVPAVN